MLRPADRTAAMTDDAIPSGPVDFTDDPAVAAWSHVAPEGAPGALVLHGFTGNPSSVRGLAEAFAGAGLHVELPRLPGHGTTVADMLTTGWADWSNAVARSLDELAQRTDRVVVAGLSMGGALALWLALSQTPDVGVGVVRGLVLVNPLTMAQPPEVRAMLDEFVADGMEIVPGIGSDIAEPGVVELSYDGTPLRQLISLLDDGMAPITERYGELTVPLLLFTSRQDHVVEPTQSEHLAATCGGTVDHRWLERSFHVATRDYEADDIIAGALAFARQVLGDPVTADVVMVVAE